MKISEANIVAGILSNIKLNKIEDKQVKSDLLKTFLALRKAVKEAQEDKLELVKKFQEDWNEELAAVNAFRKENRPVIGHKEYLEAEKDANETIAEIFEKEIDINHTPIPLEVFTEACHSEDITFEQTALLQEFGIIY